MFWHRYLSDPPTTKLPLGNQREPCHPSDGPKLLPQSLCAGCSFCLDTLSLDTCSAQSLTFYNFGLKFYLFDLPYHIMKYSSSLRPPALVVPLTLLFLHSTYHLLTYSLPYTTYLFIMFIVHRLFVPLEFKSHQVNELTLFFTDIRA